MTLLRPQDEEGVGGEAGSNVGAAPEGGSRQALAEGLWCRRRSPERRRCLPIHEGLISKSRTAVISLFPLYYTVCQGRVRSRRQEDVLREIRGLAESGVKRGSPDRDSSELLRDGFH